MDTTIDIVCVYSQECEKPLTDSILSPNQSFNTWNTIITNYLQQFDYKCICTCSLVGLNSLLFCKSSLVTSISEIKSDRYSTTILGNKV